MLLEIRPSIQESSANLMSLTFSLLIEQALVYIVNNTGDKTYPLGEPLLVVIAFEMTFWKFTNRIIIEYTTCKLPWLEIESTEKVIYNSKCYSQSQNCNRSI